MPRTDTKTLILGALESHEAAELASFIRISKESKPRTT
jgi:hypothetical protein